MMSVPTYACRIVITDVALYNAPGTGQKRRHGGGSISMSAILGCWKSFVSR